MFKRALAIVIILSAMVAVVGFAYYQYITQRTLNLADHVVKITPGDTLPVVHQQLKDMGLVDKTHALRLYARLNDIGGRLQVGTYRFSQPLSYRELLQKLSNGEGRIGAKITIIEGWTFAMMRARLAKEEDLKQVTKDWPAEKLMQELGAPDMHPEGRFYPDTYFYQSGDSDLMVYRQAFRLMEEKLAEAWSQRQPDLQIQTPEQALILASIIERETNLDAEKSMIAGVFHNRMKIDMRLQTDPTVIYGLGDTFDGDLKRSHLRTDTPYNTYTRKGLPPTPISLPSYSSLLAAVSPDALDALYFVADGEGGHVFSKTYDQHVRALRAYLKKLRQ